MIKVSLIIPCRNEEKFIGKCLDSIIRQDYPKDNLEVLLMDGMSQDGTKEIIEGYSRKYPFIRYFKNPRKFTPFALNIGIKEAKGEIIVRLDSHAGYQEDYISKCLKYLEEYQADNVGGVIRTLPSVKTVIAEAIAFVLSNRFGAASSFRVGSKEPRWTDTVFGGCYKKEIFGRIGLFNEKMIRSQDIEFNKRLKKAGGKILLVPEIVADYFPQTTLKGFLRHNFIDGFWTIYPLKFGIKFFSLRHLLPLFFVAFLLSTMILGFFFFPFRAVFVLSFGFYFLVNTVVSLSVSLKRGIKYFPVLPLAFASRHLAYGLGSLWALIKVKLN